MGKIPDWLQEELKAHEAESAGEAHHEPSAEERQRARDEVNHWCEDLPPVFRQVEPRLVEGLPSQQLLHLIEAEPVDLVVVGAHRRGPWGRLFLGSTSEQVVSRAPCAVLIARQHEHP